MTDLDMRISELASSLKLPAFKKHRDIVRHDAAFEDNLYALMAEEQSRRHKDAVKRNIGRAGFPTIKTMDTFEFVGNLPNLTQERAQALASCDFISRKANVCALGPSGTGKTHLMTAIAVEAISKGHSVRFYRTNDLIVKLNEAKSDKRLAALYAALKKCDLLCLDELGYVNVSTKNAQLLFNVIASRYETGSTFVTSNYEFSKWASFLGDPVMTAALIERLVQNSHVLNMNGDSYRLRGRAK